MEGLLICLLGSQLIMQEEKTIFINGILATTIPIFCLGIFFALLMLIQDSSLIQQKVDRQ